MGLNRPFRRFSRTSGRFRSGKWQTDRAGWPDEPCWRSPTALWNRGTSDCEPADRWKGSMVVTLRSLSATEARHRWTTHLLVQCDYLRKKIDLQFEHVLFARARSNALDEENSPGNAEVSLLNLLGPVVEDLLRVELQSEAVAVRFQFLAFDMVFPSLAQDVLHTTHVRGQLPIDLRTNNRQLWLWRQKKRPGTMIKSRTYDEPALPRWSSQTPVAGRERGSCGRTCSACTGPETNSAILIPHYFPTDYP